MPVKTLPVGFRSCKLKVDGEAPSYIDSSGRRFSQSQCTCECGKRVIVRNRGLRSGEARSCGCLRQELCKASKTKHGNSGTAQRRASGTYISWCGMIRRCTNPKEKGYHNYGGRGITVCERWRTSFENFLADMGERPSHLMIDRINNDGNYEPGNCKWSDRKTQRRNSREAHIVTVGDFTGCLADACAHFGISYQRTLMRIYRGWSVEDAFAPESRLNVRWRRDAE